MIARAIAVTVTTGSMLLACASIDPPAPFIKPDAGVGGTDPDAGPFERCRVLERRFVTDADARIYGAAGGAQAVCITLRLPIPAAGEGALVFCVAGDLDGVDVPSVRDLSPDLRTCAYCTDVQTSCASNDASTTLTCTTSYAPIAGQARIVRFGRAPGEPVWIDIGGLVVARVTRRDDTSFDLERRDCLFADGLTLQGTLAIGPAASCAGVEQTACTIASTASSRFP